MQDSHTNTDAHIPLHPTYAKTNLKFFLYLTLSTLMRFLCMHEAGCTKPATLSRGHRK
jgi:hypothetical protein